MVDPNELQIRADQNEPPFTYQNEEIKKIAIQETRKKPNHVYLIDSKKWIVYHETENSPMFMKFALDNPTQPGAEPMSLFYERFTKPDEQWLAINRYKLL